MIKAIAFDLVGVLVKENDYFLNPIEQKLESGFGKYNFDATYFAWAKAETELPLPELEMRVRHIINHIYDLRETGIFEKLPSLRFCLATNHLSFVRKWFISLPISRHFETFVISAEIGYQKPENKFYVTIVDKLGMKPAEILFIDDHLENCQGAAKLGFQTLHFQNHRELSREILDRLR